MMRGIKRYASLLLALLMTLTAAGCWNYREIDRLAIVAGVAVDKGETAKYKVTIDLIQISQERDAKPKSRIITSEGESIFDAVRNAISVAGKRLYWSHAKVIIISQEVAGEGVLKIVDWYTRDAETRADVNLLISAEKTAGEIFTESEEGQDVKSIMLHEIIKNEKSLSKAPDTQIYQYINMLAAPGMSPVAAAVKLKDEDGKKVLQLWGTAVFLHDKFLGFLDGEQTLSLQFLRNEVEGGVLVQKEEGEEGETTLSLEIFDNETEIKPMMGEDNQIVIGVSTKTDVAIDEIAGSENFIEDGKREKLEEDVENTLKARLEENVQLVQNEFGADIYGFGNKIYQDYPAIWKSISAQWLEQFRTLRVIVECEVHIRNSAMHFKTAQVGD